MVPTPNTHTHNYTHFYTHAHTHYTHTHTHNYTHAHTRTLHTHTHTHTHTQGCCCTTVRVQAELHHLVHRHSGGAILLAVRILMHRLETGEKSQQLHTPDLHQILFKSLPSILHHILLKLSIHVYTCTYINITK